MGLPIWRDPDERKEAAKAKVDPTAALRSSIRRRPAVHGRRSGNRTRLPRDPSLLPPLLERSPPPSVGFGGWRDSRRNAHRGVPAIGTLLETLNGPRAASAPNAAHDLRVYRMLHEPTRQEPLSHQLRELQQELQQEQSSLLAQRQRYRQEQQRDIAHETSAALAYLREAREEANRVLDGPIPDVQDQTPTEVFIDRDGHVNIRSGLEGRNSRPRTQDGPTRNSLPTPPHDTSDTDTVLVNPGEIDQPVAQRRFHPLSRSWRPDSLADGLGDRNRSPTPTDAWEVIQTTITPDETLPSAESSFATVAESQSFNSHNESSTTERQNTSSTGRSRRGSSNIDNSDSVSSIDPEDLDCYDADILATQRFAEDMYFHEMSSHEGRTRIVSHQEIRGREGNRFALAHEPERVDLGFRLIEEAMDTDEGRERLAYVGQLSHQHAAESFQDVEHTQRHMNVRFRTNRRSDDGPPSPHPERHSDAARDAVRRTAAEVHNYFNRFTENAINRSNRDDLERRQGPPIPEWPRPFEEMEVETSRDGPEAQPVGPPTPNRGRSPSNERDEVSEAILGSGDETDLAAMRRVVERLARRDDVPDEWWSGIGLNLSRTRPTDRANRGERGDSRL